MAKVGKQHKATQLEQAKMTIKPDLFGHDLVECLMACLKIHTMDDITSFQEHGQAELKDEYTVLSEEEEAEEALKLNADASHKK